MSWQGIVGHDDVAEQFRRSLTAGRLAHAFLFVGPPGVGKRSFALRLSQVLLCAAPRESELAPCGECESCRLFAAGNHPDVEIISRPADKSTIPLELLIGRDEKRMREGLCHNLSLKPYLGGRKVAVIDDADHLNVEGANCLLKTLEEPPPRSVLFLIGTSPDKQLPTIRSRCQLVRFSPLSTGQVEQLLLEHALVDDPETARRAAAFSEGSVTRAIELADPELWKFRGQLLGHLSDEAAESVRFAQAVSAFVDEAGREAPLRRTRLRHVLLQAIEFYRQLLRDAVGGAPSADRDVQASVQRARSWLGEDEQAVVACLERSLEALGQVDRNVNLATLVESWIDDLARQPPRAARRG